MECFLCYNIVESTLASDCCAIALCHNCSSDYNAVLTNHGTCLNCGADQVNLVSTSATTTPRASECQGLIQSYLDQASQLLQQEEKYYRDLSLHLQYPAEHPQRLVNKLPQAIEYYSEVSLKAFRHSLEQLAQILTNLSKTNSLLSSVNIQRLQLQLPTRSIAVVEWFRQGYQQPDHYYPAALAELHVVVQSYRPGLTGVVQRSLTKPDRQFTTSYFRGRKEGYHQVVEGTAVHVMTNHKGRLNGWFRTWSILAGGDTVWSAMSREQSDHRSGIIRPAQLRLYRETHYVKGRKQGWDKSYGINWCSRSYLASRRHWSRDRLHGLVETFHNQHNHQRVWYQYGDTQFSPRLNIYDQSYSRTYQLSDDSHTVKTETQEVRWPYTDYIHQISWFLPTILNGFDQPLRYLEQHYRANGQLKLESCHYRDYYAGVTTYQEEIVVNDCDDSRHCQEWSKYRFDYQVFDTIRGQAIRPEVFSNQLVRTKRRLDDQVDRLELLTCQLAPNFTLELHRNLAAIDLLNKVAAAMTEVFHVNTTTKIIVKTAVVKDDGTVVSTS